MANGLSTRIESPLTAAVRNYLLAEPNERISEDENLRPVCHWLTRLLMELLKSEGGWNQYDSVDDISPCTAERASPNDLMFTGLLIWMSGRKSSEWKEPLFAAIHISGGSPAELTYEIRFADADRGLGKCPYGTPHDFPYVPVNNWLFKFVSSDSCE